MQSMLRETARLGANLSMYLDRMPFLVWAGFTIPVVSFWGLAIVGAVTVARAVLG